MQQYIALCYLFNSSKKKVGSINIALENLLLKIIAKKFGGNKTLFDFFDESKIRDFGYVIIVLY